jgi:sulfide:quinone oxidoreductase
VSEFRVAVCGGGIAAAEGVLRLRRLVGDATEIILVAPNDELAYRPLAVKEPFASGDVRRYPLRRLVDEVDAQWVNEALERVDLAGQLVHTDAGRAIEWDALLIAVGGRAQPAFAHAETFSDLAASFGGLVRDVEEGYAKSIAFLVPPGPVWPLPLYELALMMRERAYSMGMDDLELSLVTPEVVPLAAFGGNASEAVSRSLAEARVSAFCAAGAEVPEARRVIVQPQGLALEATRIVTLPRISGPAIRGLAAGSMDGFVPIDSTCAVPGTMGRVFAAGDAVSFPIKHGGLGCQQADTAAANIARLAGADVAPAVFAPVIRGMLLTGKDPLYLSARVVGPRGFHSEVHQQPPWPADEKIVAEELGPFIARLDAER